MKQIKEITGIIYLTVNLVNGMGYVGFHYTSADDGYFGSGKILKRAVKKYGKEAFRRVILDHYDTLNDLELKETYWIELLNTRNRKIGYNITKGGLAGPKMCGNDNPSKRLDVRIKISKKMKNRKITWGDKISKTKKGTFKGKDNPFYDKKHDSETIDYLTYINTGKIVSQKTIDLMKDGRRKGKNNANYRIISQEDINKIKIDYECGILTISNILKKYNIRFEKLTELKIEFKFKNRNDIIQNTKPIFINDKLYLSINDASRKLDIPSSTIRRRLKSKNFKEYVYVD